jgi:23S rRNA (uracil1939-C5)-methyltransferase
MVKPGKNTSLVLQAMPRRSRARVAPESHGVSDPIRVEGLDLDAQGIARLAPTEEAAARGESGKVIFIRGALPTELVRYQITRDKSRFSKAKVIDILKEAVFRAKPACEYFGVCGGCTMQHLDIRAQIAIKQRVLEDDLLHIGQLRPQEVLRPMAGPTWQYRHRARFSVVNRSIKKGTVLVGFHEHQSAYVADMLSCAILPKHVSDLLEPMRALIMSLSDPSRVPQIELAVGEGAEIGSQVTALAIRHLEPLTESDQAAIKAFADRHGVWIWLQPSGLQSLAPFHPPTGTLCYRLPEFGIEMPFKPADFTQVNHLMNRSLVSRALRLLEVQAGDRVLDLFCGIGNFSLPLALTASAVLGIEGLAGLVERATENAAHNQLSHKARFIQSDLFEVSIDTIVSWGKAERWLIDPPREGAMAICQALANIVQASAAGQHEWDGFLPKRIVYVSCNPKTLARDAAILVHQAGYQLQSAGIINMFPHTSHVESIGVFERSRPSIK